MSRKLHGKNASIYFNGTKVSVKSEWSISVQWEYADVTTFRSRNKVYAIGLPEIQGRFSGFLDDDGDAAVTLSDGSIVTIAVYPEDGGPAIATGPGYIDVEVSASVSDAVKCSGSFKAAGDWTF